MAHVTRTRSRRRRVLLYAGLLLFILGAVADVLAHALPARLAAELAPILGRDGYNAHLLTLAGMAVICAALVLEGISRGRRYVCRPPAR